MRSALICIYKITSINKGIYIGQTTDSKERFNTYMRLDCKSQSRLYNSLKKHGVENHTFEIIHILEKCDLTKSEIREELNRLEIHYIKEFNCFSGDNDKFGLNLTRGGDNKEWSKESREKSSKKAIIRLSNPENHPMYNKHQKKETKDKISSKNKGCVRSEESKQKQKETIEKNGGVWNKGKIGIHTEKGIEIIRNSKLGKPMSLDSIKKRNETYKNKPQDEKDAKIEKFNNTMNNKTQEEKNIIYDKISL